jgi:hypothetical protein
MQQPTDDNVAKIASYLKTKHHLDSLYPAHGKPHLPDVEASLSDTIIFVGTTKVVGGKKIAVIFTLPFEVTAALIQHINFLDRIL